MYTLVALPWLQHNAMQKPVDAHTHTHTPKMTCGEAQEVSHAPRTDTSAILDEIHSQMGA